MNFRTVLCTLFFAAITIIPSNVSAADDAINVNRNFGTKIIPISLSGYTGEAASVLRFDLEVAGFDITTDDKAQYALSGKSDGGQVEGRLQDKLSKANLLAKAYTGDNTRAQSH